jgi:hypothetical protein
MRNLRKVAIATVMLIPAQISGQLVQPRDPPQAVSARIVENLGNAANRIPAARTALVDDPHLDRRFELAGTTLGSISDIVANVNQVLLFAAIEQEVGTATSPWSDANFRNWADKADSWGSTAGLLAAAVLPFIDTENQETWVGVGVGMAGLAKLTGSFLGQQSGARFEQRVSFVEYTRRAYDDIRARNAITMGYVTANDALRADIQKFLAEEYQGALTETDTVLAKERKAEVLANANAYLTRFDIVMTQIPSMLRLYEETISKYCPDALALSRDSPQNIGAAVCAIQPAGVKEPIMLQGGAKTFLLRAAEHLQQLRASGPAADQIRQLTPELRAALSGQ